MMQRQKVIANVLMVLGAITLFVFLQPMYEHKYLGKEARSITDFRFGLPNSPWLTYKADSKNELAPNLGLRVFVRSGSWPFLAAGVFLIWFASRAQRLQLKVEAPN